MTWREALMSWFGPGYFGGSIPSTWLRVLRDNQFAVDPPYWPRAMVITLITFQNALLAGWENLAFGRKVRDATIHPPLFILGIFRSGTTLLHNLFAQDDRFAYPNVYQAAYPHGVSHDGGDKHSVIAVFPSRSTSSRRDRFRHARDGGGRVRALRSHRPKHGDGLGFPSPG